MKPGREPGTAVSFTAPQAILAALLLLMTVLNYLDRQALSILSPLMRRDLGLSLADYANAVNAFLAAYGLMYGGSGIILDRIGYRAGLALFVGFWSLFSGLHAATAGLASLMAFRFLLGAAEPGGFTGAVKTIAERFSPPQRALATGIFTSGAGIGSLIAAPLLVFLSLRFGWRLAFVLPACAGLLWVPLWLLATRGSSGRAEKTPAPSTGGLAERLRLLGNRRVLAYLLTRFFGDSSGYFFLFWMPEYLVSSKHFSFVMLGTLGWIPPCGMDLGAILGGYVSSRLVQSGLPPVLSRKIMMTAAAALVLAGALLQGASGAAAVITSLTVCTLGVGVWASNLHALPADGFASGIVATVHGMAGSAGAVGGILFNMLVGYFSARGRYTALFVTFAMLQPLGLVGLWLWLDDQRAVQPPSTGRVTPVT